MQRLWSAATGDVTHHWNVNKTVREELVVQAWQVSTAVIQELYREGCLNGKGILAFDDCDEVFLVLLDLVALGAEVLDDVGRTVEAGGGGDVVQRRVLGQGRRARRSQELLVHSLQCHSENGTMEQVSTGQDLRRGWVKVGVMLEARWLWSRSAFRGGARQCGRNGRDGKENKRKHRT